MRQSYSNGPPRAPKTVGAQLASPTARSAVLIGATSRRDAGQRVTSLVRSVSLGQACGCTPLSLQVSISDA